MAKALQLSDDALIEAPPVPMAAQVKPAADAAPKKAAAKPIKKIIEPLQVRWPAEDVKAVKLAAIQQDYSTVSDFMLACFHAFMANREH